MIHHDYLLRLIEEFTRALARVAELKDGPRRADAGPAMDAELRRLAGVDRASLLGLSTTELLARLARAGTALEVRQRAFFLVALLEESADLETAEGNEPRGTETRIKALDLLLDLLARPDSGDSPGFAPTVEALRAALGGESLPPGTAARLMHHYERSGEFARAEDVLHELTESLAGGAGAGEVLDFGIAFYRRLLARSDESLEDGRLPRAEVEAGLASLAARARPAASAA